MGFKRPLVQIQSLGPNKQGYLLVPLFVCFGYLVRTPAASCILINGRKAAKRRPSPRRPLVQIQSLGPGKRDMREHVSFSWSSFSAAMRRRDPLRSNHWEGIPNPLPNPPHAGRDAGESTGLAPDHHFNPLAPCGARRRSPSRLCIFSHISTHSPRAGRYAARSTSRTR